MESQTLIPLTVIEIVVLVVYLMFLIHRYAAKDVPMYVKVICLIAWLLSFVLVIVLPLNIYDTMHTNDWSLDVLWISLYWINFGLSWTFLPISQEYENAGEFTFKQKMIRSLRNNLIFYAVGALISLIFMVYLILHDSLTYTSILALGVVISNGFGLLLIVILLGYGLVAIPQSFMREKDDYVRANKVYQQINMASTRMKALNVDLEDLIQSLLMLRNKYRNNIEFAEYFEQVLSKVSAGRIAQAEAQKVHNTDDLDPLNDLNVEVLAQWNKEIKSMVREIARHEQNIEILYQSALFIEDTIQSKQGGQAISSNIRPQRGGRMGSCVDWIVWVWHCRLRSHMTVLCSVLFGALSFLIILSQVSIFSGWNEINAFGNMFFADQSYVSVQEILCLIPLGYILYCLQYGLLSIQIAGFYGFYNYQHTDGPSMLFAATFISRVSFPLAFNFLWMVHIDNSRLSNVAGAFNFDSFLVSFKFILPILLLVVTASNLLNLYDRILNAMGIVQFQFQAQYTDENVEEGRKLVKIERQKLELEETSTYSAQITNSRDSQVPFIVST